MPPTVPVCCGEINPPTELNPGSRGAFCRKLSIAPVGSASANIPTPPLTTVFVDPFGDQAKPIFGCAAIAVTEGNAVCNPDVIAVFTGCRDWPKAPGVSLWKQLIWHTGLDRWSSLRLRVSFRLLVTLTSSEP